MEKSFSGQPVDDLREPIGAGSLATGGTSKWGEDVEVYEWGGLQFRVGIDDTP